MSRYDPQSPLRVIALSALLFAALLVGAWMAFAPRGESPPAPEAGAPEPAVPSERVDESPVESALPAGETGDAQPGPEAVTPDPSTAEGRAALAAARASAGTMELRLFLIVPGMERLIPVPLTATAPTTIESQIQRAVQELIDWSGTDAVSPVPPETVLREVWVSPGGIAYLDFGRSLLDIPGTGSLGELHVVYGIVATITESFPEIRAVQFLVQGATVDTLRGHVDLSGPLLPSADWVLLEPDRSPAQESDEPG